MDVSSLSIGRANCFPDVWDTDFSQGITVAVWYDLDKCYGHGTIGTVELFTANIAMSHALVYFH